MDTTKAILLGTSRPIYHTPGKDLERMGKKLYPTDTVQQAQSILSAWNLIDPSLVFGPLTSASLSADVATVQTLQEKIIRLQNELMDTRNQRDAACIGIWDKVKRARA
ncbi:MAG TPA: hypothetical protein VK909_18445, partial [Anaerolineales bacterium]|nr:hypothetical protein [Anaerolineales bacterium]